MIILVTSGDAVRDIMIEAYELGMGNGEYVFFAIELIKSTSASGDYSWYRPGDKRNKQIREMYESLMMVAVRVPTSAEYTSFTHKVLQKALNEGSTGKTIIEEVGN